MAYSQRLRSLSLSKGPDRGRTLRQAQRPATNPQDCPAGPPPDAFPNGFPPCVRPRGFRSLIRSLSLSKGPFRSRCFDFTKPLCGLESSTSGNSPLGHRPLSWAGGIYPISRLCKKKFANFALFSKKPLDRICGPVIRCFYGFQRKWGKVFDADSPAVP